MAHIFVQFATLNVIIISTRAIILRKGHRFLKFSTISDRLIPVKLFLFLFPIQYQLL